MATHKSKIIEWYVPDEMNIHSDIKKLFISPNDDAGSIIDFTIEKIDEFSEEFFDCEVIGLVIPDKEYPSYILHSGLLPKYRWNNQTGIWETPYDYDKYYEEL